MIMQYVKGNLFDHLEPNIIIPHVCNNKGGWGSGFVVPLGQKFPEAKTYYRQFIAEYDLGTNQYIQCGNVTVCNMIAQTLGGKRPLYYNKLAECMDNLAFYCRAQRIKKIFAPKFGSGLSGGNWDFVSELIIDCWSEFDVTIFYL